MWDLLCDRVFPPLLVFLLAAAVVCPCAAIAVAYSSAVAVVCSSVAGIPASDSPPPSSPSKVFLPAPVILPPLPPLVCRLWYCAASPCVGYCVSLVIVMAEEMTPKIDVAFDTGSNTKSKNLPVQITSIWLNKDNYLPWSAALEIGITSRGRLSYITGEKPAPYKTDPRWATWALEDSQVKVWIISSVSADIQPLILQWMDRTFIFLGGFRDEFESIRSQILNCDEIPAIEEVYARVESEEQRHQVMHIASSHGSSLSTFVSRASGTGQRPVRRCSHCNKLGHSVDFCWDLHPEKRLVRGRPPSSRRGAFVPDSNPDPNPWRERARREGTSPSPFPLFSRLSPGYSRASTEKKKTKVVQAVAGPAAATAAARGYTGHVPSTLSYQIRSSRHFEESCECATSSRLPNLGVLGKAECLFLELTHPWMSALPLQRMDGSILFWVTTGVVSRL
ncbi:hypothetical protein EJ110_NYTH55509 [Nymphaea thermarum]|nr:hypothetical protein EJ110_NYTH55509 [Nymphaea thermarum]